MLDKILDGVSHIIFRAMFTGVQMKVDGVATVILLQTYIYVSTACNEITPENTACLPVALFSTENRHQQEKCIL